MPGLNYVPGTLLLFPRKRGIVLGAINPAIDIDGGKPLERRPGTTAGQRIYGNGQRALYLKVTKNWYLIMKKGVN